MDTIAWSSGGVICMDNIKAFIRGLPKTDLHMHIEGSIEPQLMLDLATRNGMKLRWDTAEALRSAYRFDNLQSFLDLYFEGCKVLVTERDFHDATLTYLRRAHEDGVVRAELFIGPQSFTGAGTPIEALTPTRRRRGRRASGLVCAQMWHDSAFRTVDFGPASAPRGQPRPQMAEAQPGSTAWRCTAHPIGSGARNHGRSMPSSRRPSMIASPMSRAGRVSRGRVRRTFPSQPALPLPSR